MCYHCQFLDQFNLAHLSTLLSPVIYPLRFFTLLSLHPSNPPLYPLLASTFSYATQSLIPDIMKSCFMIILKTHNQEHALLPAMTHLSTPTLIKSKFNLKGIEHDVDPSLSSWAIATLPYFLYVAKTKLLRTGTAFLFSVSSTMHTCGTVSTW